MIRIEPLPNHKTPENSPVEALPQGLLIILLTIFLIIISKMIRMIIRKELCKYLTELQGPSQKKYP